LNIRLWTYQARRWLLYAMLPAVVIGTLAVVYASHEPNTYQTSVVLYVQVPAADAAVPGSTDVYTSQAIIPTYSQMITAPIIARVVDHAMATRYPGYRLEAHDLKVIGPQTLTSQQQTQLLTVTVTDTDAVRAAVAANTAARSFIKRITAIQRARFRGGARSIQRQINVTRANIQAVSQRIASYAGSQAGLADLKAQLSSYQSIYQTLLAAQQEFRVGKITALNAVKVFSPAQVPTSPIGPHPARTGFLAALVAFLLCAGGVLAYDYVDDSPRSAEEIADIVGAPILGAVQRFDSARAGAILVAADRPPAAEAYRIIRTNILFSAADRRPRVIVVTSALPLEGKSATAANLAQVLAESGRTTTLVDGDLRRPSLHTMFGVGQGDGLSDLLTGETPLNGHGLRATREPSLQFLASGSAAPRPADLLGSPRMDALVRHLREESDVVVIDAPPLLTVTDAALLATVADAVVLVVDPHRSARRDLVRARAVVEAVGGRILGTVINRVDKHAPGYYSYCYRHHDGYPDNRDVAERPAPARAINTEEPVTR